MLQNNIHVLMLFIVGLWCYHILFIIFVFYCHAIVQHSLFICATMKLLFNALLSKLKLSATTMCSGRETNMLSLKWTKLAKAQA